MSIYLYLFASLSVCLSVSVCLFMCICVHACLSLSISTCIFWSLPMLCAYVSVCLLVCVCAYVSVCLCLCLRLSACLCLWLCLRLSACLCLCVCCMPVCMSVCASVQSSRPCVCLLHHVEVLGRDKDGTEGSLVDLCSSDTCASSVVCDYVLYQLPLRQLERYLRRLNLDIINRCEIWAAAF